MKENEEVALHERGASARTTLAVRGGWLVNWRKLRDEEPPEREAPPPPKREPDTVPERDVPTTPERDPSTPVEPVPGPNIPPFPDTEPATPPQTEPPTTPGYPTGLASGESRIAAPTCGAVA